MGAPELALEGIRILVVEDEYYLADDLVRALRGAGADVIGPMSNLDSVRALASDGIDIAVLDMNIHGQFSHDIADRFVADKVPVLITTGYSKGALPERLRGLPQIEKPFDVRTVVAQIASQLGTQKA